MFGFCLKGVCQNVRSRSFGKGRVPEKSESGDCQAAESAQDFFLFPGADFNCCIWDRFWIWNSDDKSGRTGESACL